MRSLPKLTFLNLLIYSISFLFISAFLASFYHLVHPHSKPGTGTLILFISLIILTGTYLFYSFKTSLKYTHAIIFLFAGGLAIRIVTIFCMEAEQVSDFQIFHELALSLHEGTGFSYTGPVGLAGDVKLFLNNHNPIPPVKTAFRLPGYPLFLSFVYKITGPRIIAGLLFNAVMGSLIGVFLFILLHSISSRVAFISASLWQFYPSSVFATNMLCTEILFALLILCVALLIHASIKNRGRLNYLFLFLAGLLTSSAILTRPSTQLYIAVLLAISLQKIPIIRKLLFLLILVAGFTLPVAAWGMRNYRTFGHFEMQTTEIGVGWVTLTRQLGGTRSNPELDSLQRKYAEASDEFERAEFGKKVGKIRFKDAIYSGQILGRIFQNHLKAWRDDIDFLFWSIQDSEEEYVSSMSGNVLIFISRLYYLFLLVSAAIGALIAGDTYLKQNCGLTFLLLYSIGSAILMILFEGQPRYHFSLIMLICVFAATSSGFFSQLARHRIR